MSKSTCNYDDEVLHTGSEGNFLRLTWFLQTSLNKSDNKAYANFPVKRASNREKRKRHYILLIRKCVFGNKMY